MGSTKEINYKELYDSLAAQTLSQGVEIAWKNMEVDDLPRAIAAGLLISKLNPVSILEVAAGYGFVTKQLTVFNPNAKITCLEIATPFCNILRKQYEVIEADFLTVELERKWDVVTIMQVLEHLTDLEVLVNVLKKVTSWSNRYVFVEIPEGGPIDGERHILSLTGETVVSIMGEIGLKVKKSRMPPFGRQIDNGYTGMIQIVGEK